MNCLNGFHTTSARDKHYEYCRYNGHVKAKMNSEKEKWLKFHERQYKFKALFMIYVEFESIIKPLDKENREKVNKMKTERKGKTPFTEKNKHTCTVRMVCAQHVCICRAHRRRGITLVRKISTATHDGAY